MGRRVDLTGERFGRLVVLHLVDYGCPGPRIWRTQCDCGNQLAATVNQLRMGKTRSCGCLRREITGGNRRTHGGSGGRHPLYSTWTGMINRCTNTHDPKFGDYGGRGIVVCDRWRRDFAAFRDDIGPKPSPQHSVDRIDNDGPYAPDNCRWATHVEQCRNRRPRRDRRVA